MAETPDSLSLTCTIIGCELLSEPERRGDGRYARIQVATYSAAAISEESLGRCCEPGNENIVGNFAPAVRGVGLQIHTHTDPQLLRCSVRSKLEQS